MESGSIGDRDEECGLLEVGEDVTPRDPKGVGGYEDVKFSKIIGGTTVCIKRLAIANKDCGQMTSNDTYFAGSWLSSVKTSEKMAAAGADYCGLVKTSHKGFCLATLKELMKDWPGGSYLVLRITPIFPVDRPLLAIGYKYNSRKVLGFIYT